MKKKSEQSAELDQAFQKAVEGANPKRKVLLIAIAAALVLALTAGLVWFLVYTKDDGLIYPNVTIFGTNYGGSTPESLAEELHKLTDSTYAHNTLTIQLPDKTLELSPADTGATLDVQKLVDLAYGYGRGGSRWQNKQDRIAAALTTYEPDVVSCMTLKQDAIQTVLDTAAQEARSSLTQPVITVTGQVPELKLTYDKAAAQEGIEHQKLSVVLGTPERSLDTEGLMEKVLAAYQANDFTPVEMEYTVTPCEAVTAQGLLDQHGVKAVDAILDETDYTITPEVLGYGFDVAALQTLLDEAGEGGTVELTFGYLPAAVTKAGIEATLFCDTLGSASSPHTSNSNRNTNLRLACKALNGKIIRPGETFSYNETLGKRTEAKGYKPAGAYVNGKTVDTVGGGICQVSSTLYYACLKADLEIVDRRNHSYTVSYLPLGMDATVSWGGPDFKFRNNTDYPIRIEASVSGGKVHIKLIGTDTKDYYIKMIYETTAGPTSGKTVYEDYKWNNKEGYKDGDVIQTAYTGRTVKTYKVKYDKETDEKLSTTYEDTSTYKSRDKIVARVEAPPAPPTTEPAPTDPKPTDPVDPAPPVETNPPEGGEGT